MKTPLQFKTDRLLLRKPSLEDDQKLFDVYASKEQISRYMTWRPHTSVVETRDFLKRCLEEWSNGKGYPYIIERLDNQGDLLERGLFGMIHMHNHSNEISFGYGIARNYWGYGYTAEALKCLVDWALQQHHIRRVTAKCDIDNKASAQVMEKSGMVFEGILRRHLVHPNISNNPRDCLFYVKGN
ncbi:MAG: GNAT family N-acetyltransferase [Sneathiella sp.]|nr:GNAT family N-acetyltransferase [Sneathiella sp.]